MYDIRYDLIGTDGRTVATDILPTPRLLAEGGGEAYCTDATLDRNPGGLWRVRDDSYDPAGTTYTRVRVVRLEERECRTCGAWYFGNIVDHANTADHKAVVAEIRGW
jgi:hypothetical protein